MKLTEKMSYLQGLIDGLDVDNSTKEGKALLQMADVMNEMVMYVEDLQSQVDELTELCDILDEDLGSVEEDFYDYDDCDCDDDCDCCCEDDDEDDYADDDFEEEEFDEVREAPLRTVKFDDFNTITDMSLYEDENFESFVMDESLTIEDFEDMTNED